MSKKDKESDKITKNDDEITPGRVRQIRQNLLLHSDSGLAHRLQQEEYAVHYDRNRTHRRESRLGVQTARDVEKEEKQELVKKQLDFYQQRQKLEENDSALARELEKGMKMQSNSTNPTNYNSDYQYSFDDQNYYEDTDRPSSVYEDTTSDEQLARFLQDEEEQLASSSTHHSRHKSTFV